MKEIIENQNTETQIDENVLPEIENVEHKPMLNYEDYYQVYSNGTIWSKREKHWLALNDNGQQYYQFYAYKPNIKPKPCLLHQVVAETFIRPILRDSKGRALEEVNHKHGKGDNSVSNLQILTPREHADFHTGENNCHWGTKKSDEQIARRQQTRRQKRMLDPNYGTMSKSKRKEHSYFMKKLWAERRAKKKAEQTIEEGN